MAAAGNLLATEQCVNGLRLGFSLHRNKIEFEDRKFFLGLLRSSRSDDNWNTVKFCLALQTCSNVYRIAEDRIVKAKIGSEIADNASTCVYADADAKWQECLASAAASC